MAMRSNFLADLAQIANGAASAFGGMREEIDNMIRQRMERALNARGLVTREEFDALRTRHEALLARVVVLEAAIAVGESPRLKKTEPLARKAVKKPDSAKKTNPARKKSAS